MVVMSKLAETTQYNKTKRRQGPPKPGSAAWAAAEKNPKIAQAGRAKRGDAGAILKAGQKRVSYGGWKEKPGAMKRWQDAVTKRLTWEKRNSWDGNHQIVPSTITFKFLAEQYAVDTKAIQGACEKAMARGKFAQYVEQKGARTAVTPKELNPLNPDGLTYEPDEPELYEANKAGASALIPPAIDKAIAGAFSVSCKKEVLKPERHYAQFMGLAGNVIRPGWDMEGGTNAIDADGRCFYGSGSRFPATRPGRGISP